MEVWQIVFVLVIVIGLVQRWRAARAKDDHDTAPDYPFAADDEAHRARLARMARHREELFENAALAPEPVAPRSAPVAPSPAPYSSGPGAASITEDVTVVMRKQVPPSDGPRRSWFGGLPMMPDGVEWPRGVNDEDRAKGEVPLHFICQIALADLPADLWGGHGPRTGWLLFFANINASEMSDRGVQRLVYTRELGTERHPPADIGPISDGTYGSSGEWTAREIVYPFVPVDLVTMPNRLYEYDDWKHASPEDLAEQLYPGEEIGDNGPCRVVSEPFSWRCLAVALDAFLEADQKPSTAERAARYQQEMAADLREPGALSRIVPSKQADIEQMRARLAETPDGDPAAMAMAERQEAYIADRERDLAAITGLLAKHGEPESVLAALERRTPEAWRRSVKGGLVQLRDFANQRGLDTPLSGEEWAEIRRELASVDADVVALARGDRRDGMKVTLDVRKMRLCDLLQGNLTSACADVAKLYYWDPARRDLLPAKDLAALEAHYRSLSDNIPQRLGGYHNGVQSSPDERGSGDLLLLQLACDYVLEMIWGDCGAVYAWITPEDLDACAFDRAEVHLECH